MPLHPLHMAVGYVVIGLVLEYFAWSQLLDHGNFLIYLAIGGPIVLIDGLALLLLPKHWLYHGFEIEPGVFEHNAECCKPKSTMKVITVAACIVGFAQALIMDKLI